MAEPAAAERGHGRQADRPRDIPRPGWRNVLRRTWSGMSEDHVSMIAAGVAFYWLLAVFPAIAAMISAWGMVLDPETIQRQIEQITAALPEDAARLVTEQARSVAEGAGGGIGIAAIGGLLLTLYAATRGVKSLIEGLNIIYGEEESRGFLTLNLIAFGLTLLLLVMLIAALGMIVVLPVVVDWLGLGSTFGTLASYLRWPLLAVVAVVGLAVVYRFGPSRTAPRWRWVGWGAVLATAVWVLGSVLFSVYVQNFGSYNETYGSIGAVVILLMWFWLTAFVVLMGAQLNAQMEHQTARDSTQGGHEPMGQRGARVADTVAERR